MTLYMTEGFILMTIGAIIWIGIYVAQKIKGD